MDTISSIYCHNLQEVVNPDSSREVNNIDFKSNELNSSYNTIQNIDSEENTLRKLTDKQTSLSEVNKNIFNDYYNDFDHISKRNANVYHRLGKRKQIIKHKMPIEENIVRPRLVRRRNKGQSKMKLNEIKKDEYQGTSLYDNNKNKSPFKENKSKYNANHDIMSYKMSQTSRGNTQNKLLALDNKKETTKDKDSITNITDSSYKDNDGSYKGNNIKTIAGENKEKTELCETEPIADKLYELQTNTQQLEQENGNSENSIQDNEYIKKGFSHKLKRISLNKQSDFEINDEHTESRNRESEPHISNLGNIKPSVQHLSDIPHLSVKLGTKFEDRENTRTDLLSVDNENQTKDKISRIHKGKDSNNDLGRKGEQSKFSDYSSEKVLESKEFLIKPPSENGVGKNVKQKKRSKNKDSLKTKRAPTSDSEGEYYVNYHRESPTGNSNVDIQENINGLKLAKHLSEDLANKRKQRDIKKRFRKHNSFYKPHRTEDGNVFGYPKNSDNNEDLKVVDVHKGQDSYNAKYDDNSEQEHRQVDVNSNNNDKYSYKEAFDEETARAMNVENTNKKYDGKKTFARQSHEPRQKGESKEKCVEYKKEKPTKKSTSTTVVTTEQCTTKGTTCVTKRTTIKTKTTSETCNKSLTTKNIDPENGKNNSEKLDIFDKYLCGQLANDFVDTVMDKVKRSRKIYKELGFRNDSEETCDRCIETKPNKMPDKETVQMAMGKCMKNNDRKSSCYMCYTVPKPMEKVLNLLVLFEKEHENCVYNKIRDDSSFIFTGDYPEQFNQNDNSVGNKYKYTSDRESFNKDTFDKQDLREEGNEERHEAQIVNQNALEDATTSEVDDKYVEHSTEAVVSKHENMDTKYDSKLNVENGIANRDISYKNNGESSLDLDEEEEDSDENDDFEMSVSPRSKFSSMQEPDTDKTDDSFDRASIKKRRKAFKSDKYSGPTNAFITPKDAEAEAASNMKSHHIAERKYGFIDNFPSKGRYEYENQHLLPKNRDVFSAYENVRQHYKAPYQYTGIRPYGENKKLSILNNYVPNEKFSHKRNPFGYPSQDDNSEGDLLQSQNNGHSVSNGFISNGWDSSEYELMPKQSNHQASEHNMLNSVPRKKYHNDYEERLNMVKRESEPSYDDEPLFFEIPNIEYDLY